MSSKNKENTQIDSAQKLAKLIKENKLVVIKISASWCGPCKNKEFLNNYTKLKSNYSTQTNVKFVELDIDNDSEIIEDKKYFDITIGSVPTFFISNNGSFIKKFEGSTYLQTINKYLYDNIS